MKKSIVLLLSALALAGSKPPCNPPTPAMNVSVYVDEFASQIPHAVIVWLVSPPKSKVYIERADSPDGYSFGPWHEIATVPPSASSFTDWGISFGSPVLYRVKTSNNCGEAVTGPVYFIYCGGVACP